MRTRFGALISALFALVIMASCSKVGDISVRDFEITSFNPNPQNFKEINCGVRVNVANNGPKVSFLSAEGELKRFGQSLGRFEVDPFDVPGRVVAWSDVSGRIFINPDLPLLSIFAFAKDFKPEQYSVSVTAVVKVGFMKTTIKKNDVALTDLMK